MIVPKNPAQILIIDDEPEVCDFISNVLEPQGFDCICQTGAVAAKQMLEEHNFDVIICDITMPKINGLEILSFVKERNPYCNVILVTGFSSTEYLAFALSLGAYDFIEKPIDINRLIEAVSNAAGSEVAGPKKLPAQAGLTVRAAKALKFADEARQASLESILALARAVEAKDPYTRRHSEYVRHYAGNLAEHVKLSHEEIESIQVAALLHDIGKIGIPDYILTKPGPLTGEEFELIKQHPVLGSEILQNISIFATEANIVRHHHECWDGSGYPDGLSEANIPLGARIIAIADSMDAMLMERIYKRSLTVQRMLSELECGSCSQFDPNLASAAIEWCKLNPHLLVLPGKELEPVCAKSA